MENVEGKQPQRQTRDTKSGNRLVRWFVLLQVMLSIQFPTGVERDNELRAAILHSCFLLHCFILQQKKELKIQMNDNGILRYFYPLSVATSEAGARHRALHTTCCWPQL